jgi:hypothetical protein
MSLTRKFLNTNKDKDRPPPAPPKEGWRKPKNEY